MMAPSQIKWSEDFSIGVGHEHREPMDARRREVYDDQGELLANITEWFIRHFSIMDAKLHSSAPDQIWLEHQERPR